MYLFPGPNWAHHLSEAILPRIFRIPQSFACSCQLAGSKGVNGVEKRQKEGCHLGSGLIEAHQLEGGGRSNNQKL